MPCCRCGHNLMNRMSPLYAGLIMVCFAALTNAVSVNLNKYTETFSRDHYTKNNSTEHEAYDRDNRTKSQETSKLKYGIASTTTNSSNVSKVAVRENGRRIPEQRSEHLKRLLMSLRNLKNRSSKDSLARTNVEHKNITINKTASGKYSERHNLMEYGSNQTSFQEVEFSHGTILPEAVLHKSESQNDLTSNNYTVSPWLGNRALINTEYVVEDSSSNLGNTVTNAESSKNSEEHPSLFTDLPDTESTSAVSGTTVSCLNCSEGDGIYNFPKISLININASAKPLEIPVEQSVNITKVPIVLSDLQNVSLVHSNETGNKYFESTYTGTSTDISEIERNTSISSSHNMKNDNSSWLPHMQENKTFLINFSEVLNNMPEVTNSSNQESVPIPTVDDDFARRGKMSNTVGSSNQPHKVKKSNLNNYFRDDYDQMSESQINYRYPIPEFQPGTILHYLEPFRRLPVLEESPQQPTAQTNEKMYINFHRNSGFGFRTKHTTTDVPIKGSTFYPIRVEDTSIQFPQKHSVMTISPTTEFPIDTRLDSHDESQIIDETEEEEDEDYLDIHDGSLTMETLAYFLIGTCCGLSILCLCIVVIALRCRRTLVHRRIKKQFRRKHCYTSNGLKPLTSMWQHQFLNHVLQQGPKRNNSSFSSSNTCNCQCVTWSLGARNLDTQPICPSQSSVYLCGRKRLPFGAASTLQYESMLGRRRPTSPPINRDQSAKPESSNENDSLDGESSAEPTTSACPKKCTCIPPSWVIHRTHSSYSACSAENVPSTKNYMRGSSELGIELRRFNRDCPPPVSGLNYLDRNEGGVYYSSNDERLI